LMLFLTWYPWYPSCLRQCRFNGWNANLVKETVPRDGLLAVTPYGEQRLRVNRDAKLWQYCFAADETPNGYPVRGLMPRRFVDILDEYRDKHYRVLTEGTEINTLFMDRKRRPLTGRSLCAALDALLHKPVTPRACRSIFAYYWLEKHPNDFENLAPILWMTIPSVLMQYADDAHKPRSFHRGRAGAK